MENESCDFCHHLKDYHYMHVGKSGWLESSSNSSLASKVEKMGGKSKEVINISNSNPSVYINNTSFASFEQHTKGICMNLLAQMGY